MIYLDGKNLTLNELVKVARFNEKVALTEEAKQRIIESRKIVDDIVDNHKVVYGITTGFGKLSQVTVEQDDVSLLQRNLIMSHACGVGEYLDEEIVRGMMLLRVNALSKGYSGIRIETVLKLIEFLNLNIHPVVPEKGSLGASGDLAPLSHMVLPILGLGEVIYKGKKYDTKELLKELNVSPLEDLHAKEGLALINGTQVMTSVGALTLYDALKLSKIADLSASLTMESLNGVRNAFNNKVHEIRPHNGQIKTAQNVLNLLENSEYITNQGEIRVQDAYTLRCVPQIHGASKDAFNHILEKIEIEMNSVTDNPLIFKDEVISAGNFHGQALALTFDYLGIAIAELANVSERRLERLVNPQLNEDLPPFLVKNSGLNSGFMIVQYSAASLVSENKVLAHPASVDSIPSSANQEDHVSMGTIGARKARQILDNTYKVVSMEILAALQAIDLKESKNLGNGTKLAYDFIRKHVDYIEEDVIMYPYINKVDELIRTEEFVNLFDKIL